MNPDGSPPAEEISTMDHPTHRRKEVADIHLNVSEKAKDRLTAAAAARGKSLTAFMLEAAEEAAKQPLPEGTGRLPATLQTAFTSTGRRGGSIGYRAIGRMVRDSLPTLKPADMSKAEWNEAVRLLKELLKGKDRDAWRWFVEYVPEIAARVPSDTRRRAAFLDGARLKS